MVTIKRAELDDKMTIEMTRADAVVLFELLSRETDRAVEKIDLNDSSELHALWRLEGRLEKALPEIFSPDYADILDAARERLRNPPAG